MRFLSISVVSMDATLALRMLILLLQVMSLQSTTQVHAIPY